MKRAVLALIGEVDALQPPTSGAADAKRYKEWHHFNIQDLTAGWHVILNLGVAGDLSDPRSGQATVILLAYHPEQGWCGTADIYPTEQVTAKAGAVDLSIGPHAIRYDQTRYTARATLKDGSLAIAAEFEPYAFPLPIRNRVPFGSGRNDLIIVPRLAAHGELRVGDQVILLDGALAYHDHNRGNWHWQDDLGWDWGFALEPRNSADPYSIVFERVTDREHRPIGEGSLVIWRGGRIFKGFLVYSMHVRYGEMRRDLVVPRVPPVLNLLWGAPRAALPSEVQIEAREEDDWVTISFTVGAGLQLMLPHEHADDYFVIYELWGTYRVHGQVKGQRLEFTTPGFAEWAES